MRKLALALSLVVIASTMAAAAPMGAAKTYPWCLIIQDQDDGWACGVKTFEQCRGEARSGNTGFCAANPAYQAPAPPARTSAGKPDRAIPGRRCARGHPISDLAEIGII